MTRRLPARRLLLAAGGVLVLVVAAALAVVLISDSGTKATVTPAEALGLEMRAEDSDSLGVASDSAFVLTSRAELTRRAVEEALRSTPVVDLRIDEESPTSFRVTPRQPLSEDVVYRFAFVSPDTGVVVTSWAYQVRSPLRVVSTLPGNEHTGVQVNSGIEVTFSSDDVFDPEEHFEITPAVEGRFERHKRTLVFVPKGLAFQTLYTVRVTKGVAVQGSDRILDEDYVFQFETVENYAARMSSVAFLRMTNEFTTVEPPIMRLYAPDRAIQRLDLSVFAYRDMQSFLDDLGKLDEAPGWASYAPSNVRVDTTLLDRVASFSADVQRGVQNPYPNEGESYVRFPDVLPTGFYLVEIDYAGKRVQGWLQVTDLASYAVVSQTETLVWVNDVLSGQPVAGAKIAVVGGPGLAPTGADGIARFDTPDDILLTVKQAGYDYTALVGRGTLVVSDDRGRVAAVPLGRVSTPGVPWASASVGGTSVNPTYDYWQFLSTDRPVYLTTDTVRFWGLARPREGEPGQEFTAQVMAPGSGPRTAIGPKVSVRSSDLGTVSGEVKLEGVAAGYYNLVVASEAGTVASTYFYVADYTKPAYKIEIEPDQRALFAGEETEVHVTASFYDGTPVPNLELRNSVSSKTEQHLTTDVQGRASFRLTAATDETGSGLRLRFG